MSDGITSYRFSAYSHVSKTYFRWRCIINVYRVRINGYAVILMLECLARTISVLDVFRVDGYADIIVFSGFGLI